ncbi:hypothetical protein ACFE04_019019 [Oxalis oulophora]
MGLRRVEADLDLKAPAEKLYNIWRKDPHVMPNISPDILQGVEHHDGHWDDYDHGSHKTWNYTHEGKTEVFKERVEFDDPNLKVRLVGVDGDVFKIYKSYDGIFHFIPKPNGGTLGRITLEYEKLNDDVPDAISYLNFIVEFIRHSDEHLVAK